MDKRIMFCVFVLVSQNLFAGPGDHNPIGTSIAIQTEETPFLQMLEQAQNAKDRAEYYKVVLLIAKSFFRGIGCEKDHIQALKYCSMALEYQDTFKQAKKLLDKIVKDLEEIKHRVEAEVHGDEDTSDDMSDDEPKPVTKPEAKKPVETEPPFGMYI